jgi:hypothetical protein
VSVTLTNLCVGAGTVSIGTDVGATVGAITITPEREMLLVQPEQVTGDCVGFVVKDGLIISFEHLEPTLTNFKQSWFCGDGSGSSPLTFGGQDTPSVHTDLIVYGTAPGGFLRTIAFYRSIAVEPGDYVLSRREGHKLGAKFRALYDLSKAEGANYGSITDATS